MQKKSFLLPLALPALLLGACSTDVDENDNVLTSSYTTANLVVPADGTQPTVSESNYNLTFKPLSGVVSLTTPGIVLSDGATAVFTTADVAYTSSATGTISFSGGTGAWGQTPVTGVSGIIPGAFYKLTTPSVPGYAVDKNYIPVAIGYRVGQDFTVRSFPKDGFYGGTTTTNYSDRDGNPKTYSNDEIIYRVKMKDACRKADVVIYNARFAPEQPSALQAIVLKDLTVTLTAQGYAVGNTPGTPVVPEVLEGGTLIPNNRYAFDIFLLNTSSDDLTEVAVTYTVAGVYNGRFAGCYYYKD